MKKTLIAIALCLIFTFSLQVISFADDYTALGLTKIQTLEGYDAPYVENANGTQPEGFTALMPSRNVNTGSFYDETRNSQTLKLGNVAETHFTFGKLYTSDKLHVSFDVFQGYPDDVESAKNKTLEVHFSANATNTYPNGIINGVMHTGTNATYNQNDPNAIPAGQAQQILNLGCENLNYPLFFVTTGWVRGYAPDSMLTAKQWHKVDMFFDKDDYSMAIYFDGILLDAYKVDKTTKEYTSTPVKQALWENAAWTAWKSVLFRFEGAKDQVTEARIPGSTTTDGGYVLLDNVYVNHYAGDNDRLTLMKDDITGLGVLLTDGTINIAFNEFMDRPVEAGDITIKHVATGNEVTDFELLQADPMQFSLKFPSLDAGRYEVSVNNVTGMISGSEVSAPIYFNTAKQYQNGISIPWIDSVDFIKYDGSLQSIQSELTTATTGIRVNFTEPVLLDENIIKENILLYCEDELKEYSSFEISEDNKSVTLVPKGLLDGASNYRFEIASGITSLESDEVNIIANPSTGLAYGVEFSVADDARMEINNELNYDDTKASFSVNIVKTNSESINATAAVASYEDVVADDGTVYKKLTGIKCLPISLSADDRCVADFSTGKLDYENADTLKAFLWSWSDNESMFSEIVDLK